jgi:hypothetical protein
VPRIEALVTDPTLPPFNRSAARYILLRKGVTVR